MPRSRILALLLLSFLAACDGSRPTRVEQQEIPDPPDGFLRFVDVAAGRYSACGLTADSLVYCWGRGHLDGEGEVTRPVRVAVQRLGSIAVGMHNTGLVRDLLCGTTAAEAVVCRGAEADGEVTVPGASGWSSVTVGGGICALAPDGGGRCWNYTSLIGVVGSTSTEGVPVGTPVEVEGGRSYASVAAGGSTACALTAGGDTWCWGYNLALQVGDASAGELVFAPALLASAPPFRDISVGEAHSCALTAAGGAFCWGLNLHQQLGRTNVPEVDCPGVSNMDTGEPAPCVATPVEVEGGPTFTAIVAASTHTCALDSAGTAYCWGTGTWGQTGTGRSGSDNRSATPQRIVGDLRFRRIVAGEHFTCAIADDDATYCWGSNQRGQLGIGADFGYVAMVPHPVATPAEP